MKWMHKSKRIFAILLILGLVCLPMLTIKCYAGIKDATVFQDVTWHYQGETGIFSDSGWLQSMCSTPNYIICLENSSNKESTPDTLMAFYRNDTDENGNPAGVDVDLAKESFGRLGYAVSFVGIDWEEKKKLIEYGDIDCIWGCFSIDGRENEYNWTEPYMISRQVVAVNRSSDIYRLSDLEGKTIAVQSTTKPESIFLERTDSRIPLVREVYSLEDRELLYTSLGKGYVDAIAAHETAIRQYMKDYDADYRILDESILTTGIGVAFAKNDTRGLSEQLSRVFEEMRACGTTRTIIGRYLSDPDKYLEVDCAAD